RSARSPAISCCCPASAATISSTTPPSARLPPEVTAGHDDPDDAPDDEDEQIRDWDTLGGRVVGGAQAVGEGLDRKGADEPVEPDRKHERGRERARHQRERQVRAVGYRARRFRPPEGGADRKPP